MKINIKDYLKRNREALDTKTAKVGGTSFIMAIIVLAIIIAVNVLCSSLPTTLTQYDISAVQLYSLTSNTKVVVNNLTDDVTIYWVCQAGKEDAVVERLLDVYGDMSDHVSVVKKDPDAYPTFAAQYTDETVSNNSLIVVSGDKNRYIAYNDIYTQDSSSYYSTGSVSYSFDGEALITTAINYVTREDLPKLLVLTGHGETSLSETAKSALQKQNIETEDFSLLNVDEVPEDADGVLINGPTSDLSSEEVSMLATYVKNGGHLMVLAGPQEESALTNLNALLEAYNVSTEDGIVIEGDRDHYAFNAPYFIIADMTSSDITDQLIDSESKVIVPIASGLKVDTSSSSSATVTALLSTSDSAFSKLDGYKLSTYDKEDADIDGPFTLAVSIEDGQNDGKIVWVSSALMLDDTYNSYSSGANVDFVMNSLSWLIGENEPISIRAKSLDYNYLTISDSQASTIKIVLIGIIPICYLLYGLSEVISRRKVK